MTEQEKKLRIRADIDGLIRKMRRDLRVFFEKQKDEIVRRVEQGEDLIAVMKDLRPKHDAQLLNGILLPYLILSERRGYKSVLGVDTKSDLGAVKFLSRNEKINQTTIEIVEQKIIANPDKNGLQIMDDYVKQYATVRAKTISTANVNGAYNDGAQNGINEFVGNKDVLDRKTYFKRWNTQRDFRVRDWHDDALGQTVLYDDWFDVMNERLIYPCDPSGSAENIVNCRCFMTIGTYKPKPAFNQPAGSVLF